ncbi:DUF4178 domain-containing protein [Micromonospora zhanjiangensis]|uniref:DUF4178 domain-containing protein n=1 Tax=Micromonospora zhanjiangensis TaxID=1522057 RepID=A0ABV8KUE3_9ACTN
MDGTMAYLVTVAGCLIAVAGIVVAVLAIRKAKRDVERTTRARAGAGNGDPFRTADDDADALRGDPRRITPGDIVEIRTVSYPVRGSVRFSEGDWTRAEHLLDDPEGGKRWLSVEEDPELELVVWAEVPGATLTPGPASLDFDGRRYTSDESGRARFTAVGTTGLNPTGTMRYHDYRAVGEDGVRLSFEAYGDSDRWELGRGERLSRAEVRIYPHTEPTPAS